MFLSFKSNYRVETIVHELVQNQNVFFELDNPMYYNIQAFKELLDKQES